jgi:hypothetical protein
LRSIVVELVRGSSNIAARHRGAIVLVIPVPSLGLPLPDLELPRFVLHAVHAPTARFLPWRCDPKTGRLDFPLIPGPLGLLVFADGASLDVDRVAFELAARCDYPLHVGLTEAGMGSKGIVASTAGIGVLLQAGIGDTIRVSLTPEPNGDRTQEVIVAQEILQTMGLRSFVPMVIACPGCGRTTSTYFQKLAQDIQSHIRHRMPEWRKQYVGVEEMNVAVMGCVVNGPGESKHANIGISLPGTGERPVAPVYEDGEKTVTLKGDHIAEEFQQLVEAYVARRFSPR